MMRILLVGGSEKIKALCMSLEDENFRVVCTTSLSLPEDEGLSSYALILFDFRLFEQGHIQKAHEVFKRCGDSPVLVFVTEKTAAFAAKILKLGASDVIVFPCCRSYLQAYIRYYASKPEEFSVPDITGAHVLKAFIGVSEASAVLKKQILLASQNDMPVLLLGETGTGKSLAARLIHDLSRRKKSPFVEENIAAVQETLVEGELFGTKAGAYTGAVTRAGLFERASGGTLFLDEIGELGLDEQAMLLKAIEEKHFYPVGSDKEVHSSFQLIAGTNRDLRREIRAGRFREDLFARINIWNYPLPALADRREDIEPNIEHQLALASQELGRATRFNKEALSAYLAFAHSNEARWRGNFRDLAASIMRLATLAPQGRIQTELVEAEIGRLKWLWADETDADDAENPFANRLSDGLPAKIDAETLDLFDRIQLQHVIAECRRHPNMAAAGRALFNVSRLERATANDSDRLRKYLQRFGLTWADIR